MRYMFLIYNREQEDNPQPPEETQRVIEHHWAVIDEATAKGVFVGAEPLQPTSTATTIRMHNGAPVTIDGPFAETKEQLAGYYIIDCADLDEAIAWAAKIPTNCGGAAGCVEIRPMPGRPARPVAQTVTAMANG